MRDFAINVKDRLWNMVNTVEDVQVFLDNAATVLSTMELQDGLWAGIGYAYKAAEICKLIVDGCNRLQRERELHHKTDAKVQQTKEKAWKLEAHFHGLQDEYRAEQVREREQEKAAVGYGRVSNMELAS